VYLAENTILLHYKCKCYFNKNLYLFKNYKKKVKLSHYGPQEVQRVPGG